VTKAVVFAGGTVNDYLRLPVNINEDDYIICADSGIVHCDFLGLEADLWVGDFDSSDFDEFSKLNAASKSKVIKLNPMKDDTDTEFALGCAVKEGYKDIVLIGGIGTRLDHSIANVFLMEKLIKDGVTLTLVNENNVLHLVENASISLKKNNMKYISILPLDTIRVTNKGFLYPLDSELLYRNSSRGVSNELTDEVGIITVDGGCALVIESID